MQPARVGAARMESAAKARVASALTILVLANAIGHAGCKWDNAEMKKQYLLGSFIVSSLLVPVLASAATTEEIQAQIQSLLSKITALQTQINSLTSYPPMTIPTPPASCPNLYRALSRGSRGSDVISLQQFLIAQRFLSNDSATGFFGSMTESAVRKWQGQSGVDPVGIVGVRTRARIAAICSPTVPPVSSPPPLDGRPSAASFIGPATLNVNERGTWRVPSMDGSCLSIDWGDGSSRDGMCDGAATFSHTYAAPGTYPITAIVGTDQVGGTRTIARTSVVVTGVPGATNPVCGQPRFVCPDTASCALLPSKTYVSRSVLEAEGAIVMHEGACRGTKSCTNYVPDERNYYDDGERVSCISGMDGVTCMSGQAYMCSFGRWQMDSGYQLVGDTGTCKVYGNGYNRCTRSKSGEPLTCARAQTNLGLGCLEPLP